MRASHAAPTAASASLQRRLEAAVEALDSARLEVDAADSGGFDREAGVLEPFQELLPFVLRSRRILLDERKVRAERERLPSRIPGCTPAASAAAVTGPSRGSSPAAGPSAAGRSASAGRSRSAARSSNPGMRRHAITYERMFYTNTRSLSNHLSAKQRIQKNTKAAPAARPPCVVSRDSLASPHAERIPFLR